MKKLLLQTITFSLLFFLCEGREQTPQEFRNTEITPEYVDEYYQRFTKHTEELYNQMNSPAANIARKAGEFFSLLFLDKTMPKEDVIQKLAFLKGYDEFSRRLLGIGRLVLDDQWRQKINNVKNNCSFEHITYLNDAKKFVLNAINEEDYGTNKALNQAMKQLHIFYVDSIQKEEGFDNNYAIYLKENLKQNNNGLYPMHAHLEQYANDHNGEVHPLGVWNMFLAYLFALNKVTSKGS